MTNLAIARGRRKVWSFAVTEGGIVPANLGASTVRFTVKRSVEDVDASAVARKTSMANNGVSWTNISLGQGTFWLEAADTGGLPDWDTDLVWDLLLVDSGGSPTHIDGGKLVVSPSVLRSTA